MKAAEKKTRSLLTSSSSLEPALVVEAMQVLQGEKIALQSLSFTVPGGGILMSIVGPNGAGKTTLLKSLLGLLPLQSGRFRFPAFEAQQRAPKLAYVPQRSTVSWDFPLSVFEVALMGTYGGLKWGRRPGKKEHVRARDALAQVGMSAEQDKPLSELSGGQAQRVFLARALAQEADFYLLDEPFAAVDLKAEALILEILIQLKKSGKTLLVVHHDLATVKSYFDWVLFLNVTKVALGPVRKTFSSAVVEKTYSAYQP